MKKDQRYQYYVEGETEEKLLGILKLDYGAIPAGRVQKFNALTQKFTSARLMQLKEDTIVVLVIDTDVCDDETLSIFYENIGLLQNQPKIKDIILIPQVKNLEDELMRSCSNIRQIKELTGSRYNSDFKTDMIKQRNLKEKLDKAGFDFLKFWESSPQRGPYLGIENKAYKIRRVLKMPLKK